MTEKTWSITQSRVDTPEAEALLRDYYISVSDSYYLLHENRVTTPEELEAGLAGSPSDDLTAPTGLFLIGSYGGEPHACAGLRVLDGDTVELTRVFVRPELRGTGGGSQLMAAVDAAARGLGARRIVLDTRLDLMAARKLYVKHGYVEIPAYSRGPYAEIWYEKGLVG